MSTCITHHCETNTLAVIGHHYNTGNFASCEQQRVNISQKLEVIQVERKLIQLSYCTVQQKQLVVQ